MTVTELSGSASRILGSHQGLCTVRRKNDPRIPTDGECPISLFPVGHRHYPALGATVQCHKRANHPDRAIPAIGVVVVVQMDDRLICHDRQPSLTRRIM